MLFNFTVSSTKELLKIGDKVCVRSFLNNVMFSRAIIVNNISNEYLVFYLDYGNEELVSSDDIFKLSEELGKVCYILHVINLISVLLRTIRHFYRCN